MAAALPQGRTAIWAAPATLMPFVVVAIDLVFTSSVQYPPYPAQARQPVIHQLLKPEIMYPKDGKLFAYSPHCIISHSLYSWTDNSADGRTLRNLYASDDMTISVCAAYAISKGYEYFGIEFGTSLEILAPSHLLIKNAGRECWAGNTLNPKSTSADSSTCNKPCGGNSNEWCGGSGRMDLSSYSVAPSST